MSRLSRALTVLTGVSLLGAWALHYAASPALGQKLARPVFKGPNVPEEPPKEGDDQTDAISLLTDRKFKKNLEAAEDFINEKDWDSASRVLQLLLDIEQDVYVQVTQKTPDGKETSRWTSVRSEANRLLGLMPADGLEVYELRSGAKAKGMLEQARGQGDIPMLARVAHQYFHTKAGLQATRLLGTHHLDRKNFVMAALLFERLLDKKYADQLQPLDLLKASVVFQQVGDKDRSAKAWDRLKKMSPSGITLGDRRNPVPLDELKRELERFGGPEVLVSVFDWPMFMGNKYRTAQGIGDTPFLDEDTERWNQPTVHNGQTENLIKAAINTQETRLNQVTLPAFFPIAANGKLVYRDYSGVQAVDLKTGKLAWMQESKWSIDKMLNDTAISAQMNQWNQHYTNGGTHSVLYENSVLGTLSTDNHLVYHVDDLALPPHPYYLQQFGFGGKPNYGALDAIIHHNRLQAVELDTGKLKWYIGGRTGQKDARGGADVLDSYFLGPPLPLGGKLYALNEQEGSLRLLCLDPANGEICWKQTLAALRDRLPNDVSRRLHACNLAYGEGILVCPTNAGAVLGVDLLTHSLVWAYSYREGQITKPQPNPWGGQPIRNMTFSAPWKSATPIIQDGKVVFTAPDGESVHCLNLRDGTRTWKANRDDSLYLGGIFNNKVILVGKNSCRALGLADGKQAWGLETGVPSGHGVASDNHFYLPLRASAQDKEPEVCVVNIDTGRIKAHTKTRKKEIPGNLLFYDGKVLSQTIYQVAAYPQLKVKIKQIDERIAANPKDPRGLTERAELRLHDGNVAGAVEDLLVALDNKPDDVIKAKGRAKLFESLTELFQRDFDKASKEYYDKYKDMCTVAIPADATPQEKQQLADEQRRRQANFLCLVAKGRERQGRLVEAFNHYMDFGGLADKAGLLSVLDEPSVKARPDVWAQGRISAMIAKATVDQSKPLKEEIAKKWTAIKGTNDVAALRNFVGVFGSLFEVGREARLHLADKLIDGNSLLEAELQLLQVYRQDKGTLGARALEGLARVMMKKGSMEDAAWYYRVLARDFPETQVRDGKTGADFLNDLATDKRFLAFLDESRFVWSNGKIKAKEEYGSFQMQYQQQVFAFEPDGGSDLIPFFQRHRMFYNPNASQVKLVDSSNNGTTWSHNINRQQTHHQNAVQYFYNMQHNPNAYKVGLKYHVQGHIGVMCVGYKVHCFDLMEKKNLWEANLFGEGGSLNANQSINIDQNGRKNIYDNQFGGMQLMGDIGHVEASYVSLVTRNGLVVLDPLTGTTLWTKSDIAETTRVFGDDQHLYLVDARSDGTIGSARALRAHDGVSVDVPDFNKEYSKRLRTIGRNLLLSDSNKQGGVTLRLYDIHTGKDVWTKEFSPKAVILNTIDSDLAGAIEPDKDGKLTVFNLKTQKEVLSTKVEPKYLEKIRQAHLIQDAERFFLATDGEGAANPFGGPFPNIVNNPSGLKVNGFVFAFRKTAFEDKDKKLPAGSIMWRSKVDDQFLILDGHKELPLLLFTAGQQKPPQGYRVSATQSINKSTGKLIYQKDVNNGNQFHTFNINLKAGTIELIGYNVKVLHYLDNSSK